MLLATPDFVMTSNRNALRRGARGGFMTDADIAVRSELKSLGVNPSGNIYHNLDAQSLIELAVERGKGNILRTKLL